MIPHVITVHASANKKGRYLTAAQLRKYHTDPKPKGKGWSDIGYHYVIRTDGIVEVGRPITRQGAHVRGHNKDNIGICLIGGLDSRGKAADNFTRAQKHSLYALLTELCDKYDIPYDQVKGHRDWSPDLNADGKITSDEFIKECPCFDVKEWFNELLLENSEYWG